MNQTSGSDNRKMIVEASGGVGHPYWENPDLKKKGATPSESAAPPAKKPAGPCYGGKNASKERTPHMHWRTPVIDVDAIEDSK